MKILQSKRKEIILLLVGCLIAWIILELGSIVVYRVVHGEGLNRAAIQARLMGTTGASPADSHQVVDVEPQFIANKVLHPYLGFVVDPKHPDANQYGFYSTDPLRHHSADTLIVGIMGGSVAMSLAQSPAGEHLLKQTFPDKHIELICLAVDGYKQPQQLMALNYLLTLGAEFDIIINLDGFNEVALPYSENIHANVFIPYPRMWNLYSRKGFNREIALQVAQIQQIKDKREQWKGVMQRFPFRHSFFFLTLWDAMDRRLRNQLYQEDAILREQLNDLETGDLGPFTPYTDFFAVFRDAVDVWKNASLQMAQLCQANQIDYFQFLQPNQYFFGSKELTPEEKKNAFVEEKYLFKEAVLAGYPTLLKAGKKLRQEGVMFTSLAMIFREEKRTIYIDTCCHMNQLGNELMAKHIEAVIARHYNNSGLDK